ncbi:MAG: DoxX family protein [Thermoplasmata archaeon]
MVLEFLSDFQDEALLVARIFVGALFLIHGLPKLVGAGRKGMREGMGQMGIPGPLFDLVGLLEFLGGLALVFGFLTRLVSLLFVLQMIGTTLLYVTKLNKAPIPRGAMEEAFRRTKGYISGWELDTVLLSACLLFAVLGPGDWALDALVSLGL